MRRIGAVLAMMIGLGIGLAFWAGSSAPAHDTQDARIAGLETRVAELETVTTSTASGDAITPTPTPVVVWQEGETFEVAGDGSATVNLWVKPGAYDVTFTCDAAGGRVRVWFPLIGGELELQAGNTNHMEFSDEVSEDVTSVMLEVTCAGAWRLTGA